MRLVNFVHLVLCFEKIIASFGIFSVRKAGVDKIHRPIPITGIVHVVVTSIAGAIDVVPPHCSTHQVIGLGKTSTDSSVLAVNWLGHHSGSCDSRQRLNRVIMPGFPLLILSFFQSVIVFAMVANPIVNLLHPDLRVRRDMRLFDQILALRPEGLVLRFGNVILKVERAELGTLFPRHAENGDNLTAHILSVLSFFVMPL